MSENRRERFLHGVKKGRNDCWGEKKEGLIHGKVPTKRGIRLFNLLILEGGKKGPTRMGCRKKRRDKNDPGKKG